MDYNNETVVAHCMSINHNDYRIRAMFGEVDVQGSRRGSDER